MSEQHERRYKVVVNDEEQYSIWTADREAPAGWREEGMSGSEEECISYIDRVWVDMRPRSARRDSDGRSVPPGTAPTEQPESIENQ
jgi:MbtH protein